MKGGLKNFKMKKLYQSIVLAGALATSALGLTGCLEDMYASDKASLFGALGDAGLVDKGLANYLADTNENEAARTEPGHSVIYVREPERYHPVKSTPKKKSLKNKPLPEVAVVSAAQVTEA